MTHASTSRRLAVLLFAAAALCLALAMAGCASYPSVEEALQGNQRQPTVSAGATLEQGVLTVGINANNAPYSWPNAAGTELQGVDVDAALAMAEEMGLTVKFVNVGTDVSAAAAGLCDVVMGATASQVPTSEVLVGNYLESAPAVFAKNPAGIVTAEQLAGAAVGVQSDSVSARALAALVPTATLTSFNTLNDAFSALRAGTVQYVACDSLMGGYLATSYADIAFAGALALPDMRGVAIAAGSVELQNAVVRALDAITSNGVLRSIRENWVGDLPSITVANQVVATQPAEPAPVEGGEGEWVPEEGGEQQW